MNQFGKAMVEFWLGVMSGFIAWMIPRDNIWSPVEIVLLATQYLMHR
jgi:hypothetical protein